MKEISEKEALQKAGRYCSGAEHCISEVVEKLKTWGTPPDSIPSIIEYLIKEKYIDEKRYCENFINEKLKYNKWGRIKIAQALWQKRISYDVSSSILENIDQEEYLMILKKILETRKKTIKAKDNYELINKLIRFGLSRGFEIEYINKCLNHSDESY